MAGAKMLQGSSLSGKVIRHKLFNEAREQMLTWAKIAPAGKVVVLIGPTQAGKSLIHREVVAALIDDFRDNRPGAVPIVSLQVENVEDGRARTKWLVIELLKVLQHPVYKHIGNMDELDHYAPSKGRDETTLRVALKQALHHRFTQRICLDEAHLLTQTKNVELRSAVLESIKSTGAIERTLFLCGGYELAYRGLFDSPHFCGRLVFVDFGWYDWSDPLHAQEWLKICKTVTPHVRPEPRSLLIDNAHYLCEGASGTLGQLDTWLLQCVAYARLKGVAVTKGVLKKFAPSKQAVNAIRKDLLAGRAALQRLVDSTGPTVAAKPASAVSRGRPFSRAPNRTPHQQMVIDD